MELKNKNKLLEYIVSHLKYLSDSRIKEYAFMVKREIEDRRDKQ